MLPPPETASGPPTLRDHPNEATLANACVTDDNRRRQGQFTIVDAAHAGEANSTTFELF
jgi:hypothetical protein